MFKEISVTINGKKTEFGSDLKASLDFIADYAAKIDSLKTVGELETGTRFIYGNVEWIKLDNAFGGCLVLTADNLFIKAFDDANKNNWAASSLRAILQECGKSKLKTLKGIKPEDLIAFDRNLTSEDGLTDYGTCKDTVSLLTCDEYRKYRKFIPKVNNWYWLITAYSTESNGYSCHVRLVGSGGTLGNSSAFSGNGGVRPLCNLDSGISVSDTTDTDGCYTLSLDSGLDSPTLNVANPIYCNPTYETGGLTGGSTQITWGEVTGATSYILERSVNNGTFAQIYSGANRSYTDTVLGTYTSLQYRVKASDGTDESDYTTSTVYVVQDNFPPFISGDETAFGDKAYKFTYKYTIYDGDDVGITVKEYLNTTLIKQYTTTTGTEQTLSMTSAQWGAISTGDNYIKIEVTDDNSSTTSQTKHFNKLAGVLELEYSPTGNTLVQPKAINVELDLVKPFIATVKVYACNNGNDTQPVWDDITTAVKSGFNHIFSNTALEQGVTNWKVIVRIVIERGEAVGDIKLSGIRCQLDCTTE